MATLDTHLATPGMRLVRSRTRGTGRTSRDVLLETGIVQFVISEVISATRVVTLATSGADRKMRIAIRESPVVVLVMREADRASRVVTRIVRVAGRTMRETPRGVNFISLASREASSVPNGHASERRPCRSGTGPSGGLA